MGLKASVESVMRSPPVTANLTDTVATVVEKMTSNNVGAIIIMSAGTPAGIVTERDVIAKLVRSRKDPTKTLAQEVMSAPLISIESNKSVTDTLRMMRDRKIRRLGVTRKGNLVGIVTERRLLDSLA